MDATGNLQYSASHILDVLDWIQGKDEQQCFLVIDQEGWYLLTIKIVKAMYQDVEEIVGETPF